MIYFYNSVFLNKLLYLYLCYGKKNKFNLHSLLSINVKNDWPGRDVPEAHVGALWLRDDQVELVRHGLDPVHLVVGQLHQPVHLLLKADASLG